MEIGVDLNRNYDFSFAYDDIGSSPSQCDEAYRGEFAFSEPETKAVSDFIIKYEHNIKLIINFHA